MLNHARNYKWLKAYIITILVIVGILVTLFFQLPYYVMKPGDAHNVDAAIEMEGAHSYDEGQFMFMTVTVYRPNIYQFLYAKFHDYRQIFPVQELRQKGETPQEYDTRQLYYMANSQLKATYVAYKHAGKQPKIIHKGVQILNIIEGMPAADVLKAGDMIVKAGGQKVKTKADLLQVVQQKGKNDKLSLTIKRDGKKKQVSVPIARFPDDIIQRQKDRDLKNIHKYGVGITFVAQLEMNVEPKVTFHTERIGGPSGGLMFTLGLYNRLTEKNWTKGYKIAGTGTIEDLQGHVGPIGGIQEKIIAANQENVDIFFAPKMAGNYKHAVEVAKDIGTDMKIVPVKTFSDALAYLQKIPPEDAEEAKDQAA